ncbi:MAG: prenyltransferase/squalene oxidase repeat-containing protein [Vicinamibacterales bacterium]|jgi:squalene-hopene/tetraprenyl-beta-curcumene cyclase
MKRLFFVALCLPFVGAMPIAADQVQPAAKPAGPAFSAETRQQLIASLNRGAEYVRKAQKPDGTWENHPGVTAMVAAALLRQTGVPREKSLQTTGKTLDYLKSLAKPDGGIYEKMIPHYITAVSVQALAAGGRAGDKAIIERARAYLADHLLDEGEGIQKNDKFYGGMGYGGTSDGGIADIISLEYGLRAMKEAELPADDPAWQKAITFLQRTQNHRETNDQSWSTNDGGFVYYPGYSQVDATTQSYGSGTYAGLMSYAWANLQKNDRRVQNALKWISANYTVDENPGIGTKALYYYYMVFAKALQAMGDPVVVDAKGVAHNWREDLAKKLIALQHPEGFWVNENPAEMQGNPVLVTSFTMMAIEAILQ